MRARFTNARTFLARNAATMPEPLVAAELFEVGPAPIRASLSSAISLRAWVRARTVQARASHAFSARRATRARSRVRTRSISVRERGGSSPDLTFTGRAEELAFIRTFKESAALPGAANLFLVQLQDAATALDGTAAVTACFNTAALMLAVRAKLVGAGSFDADHLDVLRQYACHWRAHDGTSLHRDMLLFSELLPPCGRSRATGPM